MADIAERLRHYAQQMKPCGLGGPGAALSSTRAPLLERAADEIERLRAALKPFADCKAGLILNPAPQDWQRAHDILEQRQQ